MKLCHRVLLWLAVATSLRLGPAPPGPALELGRARALRALGGGLVALPLLGNGGGAARAADDSSEDQAARLAAASASGVDAGFVKVDLGDRGSLATIAVPDAWQKRAEPNARGFETTVDGPVLSAATSRSAPTPFASITELGQLERVDLAKALGVRDVVARGDLVGGGKRKGRDGKTVAFYEWDLSLAPKDCGIEDRIVNGVCFPTEIVLLSACVDGGRLHVLELSVAPAEWKLGSKTLRQVRSSFEVADRPPPPAPAPAAPEGAAVVAS